MGQLAITNLRSPVNDYDAATKEYVDEAAPFNITFTFYQGHLTTDIEYSDLVDAIEAGRQINAIYYSQTARRGWSVLNYTYADTGVDFIFNNTTPTDSSISTLALQFVHFDADGTITKFAKSIALT